MLRTVLRRICVRYSRCPFQTHQWNFVRIPQMTRNFLTISAITISLKRILMQQAN